MTTKTMGFPGEITREVNEIRDTLLGEHEKRIEQLESDVAFLARFASLRVAGHATPAEYAHAAEIAARTERGSEQA